LTPKILKASGKEDIQTDDSIRLVRARSRVRSWQRWGLYFIIFGFITAFVTWERIFAYILGLPPGLVETNTFWIATGLAEIIAGFTLRIVGAQYERRISKGDMPRLVS